MTTREINEKLVELREVDETLSVRISNLRSKYWDRLSTTKSLVTEIIEAAKIRKILNYRIKDLQYQKEITVNKEAEKIFREFFAHGSCRVTVRTLPVGLLKPGDELVLGAMVTWEELVLEVEQKDNPFDQVEEIFNKAYKLALIVVERQR